MEESKILLWHRDKLKLSIISDKFLQTVLDHILSRDVVNKLIQVGLELLFLFFFVRCVYVLYKYRPLVIIIERIVDECTN